MTYACLGFKCFLLALTLIIVTHIILVRKKDPDSRVIIALAISILVLILIGAACMSEQAKLYRNNKAMLPKTGGKPRYELGIW